jgi:hypothetical protein
LKDLISIFHPQILKQDTLLFYRKMKNWTKLLTH